MCDDFLHQKRFHQDPNCGSWSALIFVRAAFLTLQGDGFFKTQVFMEFQKIHKTSIYV